MSNTFNTKFDTFIYWFSQKGKMPMSQCEFVTKITNDRREEEMEQNLNEVSKMIGKMSKLYTINHLFPLIMLILLIMLVK